MSQEIANTKAAYERTREHLKAIVQPNVARLQDNHRRAESIGDQFIAHLAAAEKTLLQYLEVVGSMSQGCDRQQQEGKVVEGILSKAGIVEDDSVSDIVYDAVNSVRCVGPYAERYKDAVIRPALGDLGAVGVLGALQEMQNEAKAALDEFVSNPLDEVEDMVALAINDCAQARDSI